MSKKTLDQWLSEPLEYHVAINMFKWQTNENTISSRFFEFHKLKDILRLFKEKITQCPAKFLHRSYDDLKEDIQKLVCDNKIGIYLSINPIKDVRSIHNVSPELTTDEYKLIDNKKYKKRYFCKYLDFYFERLMPSVAAEFFRTSEIICNGLADKLTHFQPTIIEKEKGIMSWLQKIINIAEEHDEPKFKVRPNININEAWVRPSEIVTALGIGKRTRVYKGITDD